MSITPQKKPVNYLTNKNILSEIHKSKCTYSSFLTPEDSDYDVIVSPPKNSDLSDLSVYITEEVISTGKEKRSSRLAIPVSEITDGDVVIRVMMWDHIPLSVKPPKKAERKKSAKDLFDFDDDPLAEIEDPSTKGDIEDMFHVRVNFPPFQHFKRKADGSFQCVGKSHWKNGVENGEFSIDHGYTTNNLAKMYIMLSEKYSMKYNWRGYTYNDEMRGAGILQLTYVGLRFNEAKSENPFAFLTQCCNNSFIRVLNTEKKNQTIRDDILEMAGLNPSYTRQNSGGSSTYEE